MNLLQALLNWELRCDGEENLVGTYLRAPRVPGLTEDLARVMQWVDSDRDTVLPKGMSK